ncbi:MAG TPA: hypothetical protein VF207_08965, partial [Chthoniobacterales bacterium]
RDGTQYLVSVMERTYPYHAASAHSRRALLHAKHTRHAGRPYHEKRTSAKVPEIASLSPPQL